ncbi:MAG TPA: hypothetical protein VFU31_29835 [Candidatus Binatia bacterium]|nr:hypothetical protein [Candidatus Binatia bacterium]
MPENKSLGQIFHDAQEQWWRQNKDMHPQDYSDLTPLGREVKEFAASAVRQAVIEECIQAIKAQQETFASEEYATGQPHSSFGERFACKSCIEALRSIANEGKTDG